MTSGFAGQTLANRYFLDFEVHTEGVGTTYAATDLQRNSITVMAKVLDVTVASDEEVQRFDRSGAVLKALRRQPWSLRLIDGGTGASLKYLIFENMNGETLAEHLRKNNGLPISDALAIAIDITAILEKFHSLGLMHGDVRPPHIFLEEDPKGIRLLSFDRILPTSLSQLRKAGLSEPQVPSTLEAPYWPPERLRQPADARYDIYALAVVIYEIVSGRRLSALLSKRPALKPVGIVKADSSIDSDLRDFLAHALNPEIAKQFQSAQEMSISLKELAQPRTLVPAELSEITIKPGSQRRFNLHANDVQLVRVYREEKGGRILEETIPSDVAFKVVVEARAGVAILGTGGKHFTQLVVRDLTGFTIATPPDVILGVEASAAEFAGGASYRVGGFARDYLSGTVAALVPVAGVVVAGALNTPDWPTRNHQFVFQLPAAVTDAAVQGGVVELVGVVRVGAAIVGPEVDFVTDMFMWVA